MSMHDGIVLKPGRDKPIRQKHPWIFSGSIRHIPGDVPDGEIAYVYSSQNEWLAQGYLNRQSQIQVRLLSWSNDEPIDDAFWERRLAQAIAGRRSLADSQETTAYRLVNGENDYLPGLVVDRFDDYLVLQAGTLAIDRRKERLAQMLLALTDAAGVLERSDLSVRHQEGLNEASGLLAGKAPPQMVDVLEAGHRFRVDLLEGQKTGFYTDQRANRRRVAAYCAGRRVLNAFAYTGAFGIYALAAGAQHVVNLDSSVEALTLGETNYRLNGFDPDVQAESLAGDVFQILRDWRDARLRPDARHFDLIVLDPPKFAHSKRNVEAALRGYKDINWLALQLLKPGGILATFSCSGLVSEDLFQKVVFGAALDADRPVQILEWLRQGPDHPVALTFPEGAYLKGLICRIPERSQ